MTRAHISAKSFDVGDHSVPNGSKCSAPRTSSIEWTEMAGRSRLALEYISRFLELGQLNEFPLLGIADGALKGRNGREPEQPELAQKQSVWFQEDRKSTRLNSSH